ncbi:TetR/AcrR family transcriptional regulator [Desulforhopalus singaporensis]|uniref:Transcriptional regulator, TetR family n=1 Tax=Desulforhopalus singaporensis TaxID=91360 RepID=A0A1H0IXG1_9BACT|nr:TetR/AcrR family transcriptional regulator [Desulforhopalus singaporensis]SDO36032.1 transcriptional regulator, TetR family [Desulforhopalus singaporensis]
MTTEKLPTEVRKEQIVEAALAILGDQEIKKLKMTDVARHMGLAPSALYRHFRNRDAMLSAVLEHIRARLYSNLEQVRQQTDNCVDRLKEMLFRHGRLISRQQGIPRIVFSDELWGQKRERRQRMYRIITGYLAEIEDIVREGQERGQIRTDIDAHVVAGMFLGIVQPAALLYHMGEGRFDVDGHIGGCWVVLREMIVMK